MNFNSRILLMVFMTAIALIGCGSSNDGLQDTSVYSAPSNQPLPPDQSTNLPNQGLNPSAPGPAAPVITPTPPSAPPAAEPTQPSLPNQPGGTCSAIDDDNDDDGAIDTADVDDDNDGIDDVDDPDPCGVDDDAV